MLVPHQSSSPRIFSGRVMVPVSLFFRSFFKSRKSIPSGWGKLTFISVKFPKFGLSGIVELSMAQILVCWENTSLSGVSAMSTLASSKHLSYKDVLICSPRFLYFSASLVSPKYSNISAAFCRAITNWRLMLPSLYRPPSGQTSPARF